MKKTSPIRDIVHDYIATTELELSVIDSQDFQRLRFVLQNSASYLTYPCNNSTRFTHSLGVMHLSGALFVHALKNADEMTLIDFLKLADEIFCVYLTQIGGEKNRYEDPWGERLGNVSRFFHNPTVGQRIKCLTAKNIHTKFNPEFLINTLWQAIRLGALAHDIGHYPMSHIFEKALESFRSDDYLNKNHPEFLRKNKEEFKKRIEYYTDSWGPLQRKEYGISRDLQDIGNFKNKLSNIHETRGLYILEKILRQDIDPYSRLIISLTRNIMISKTEGHLSVDELRKKDDKEETKKRNFYRTLHSIFDSSFIDADRMDYTVRDAKVSGLEYGIIDSKRIIDSIALFEKDSCFKLSFDARALSAIEFFFHQRYLLYKNLIYHHNTLRMDGMVIRIISDLIKFAYTHKQREISDILEYYGFFCESSTDQLLPRSHEEKYDDDWLRVIFTDVLIAITGITDYKENNDLYRLHLLLETFLYRKTCNIFSFWKREADHRNIYSKAIETAINESGGKLSSDEALLQLLSYMREEKISKSDYHKMVETTQANIRKEILDYNDRVEEPDQLPNHVTIIYRYVASAVFSSSGINGYIRINGNEEIDLSKVSPYLKELLTLSNNAPVDYVFFVADGMKSRGEDGSLKKTSKELQRICKACFENHLGKYLNDILEKEILTANAQ